MTLPYPAPGACLRATEAMLAVFSLLVSAELWLERSTMEANGLLSWPLQREARPAVGRALVHLGLGRLFDYPAVLFLVWFRLFTASVLLAFVLLGLPTVAPLICLAVLTALFRLRQPLSQDGAKQFAFMGMVACSAAECLGTPYASRLTLFFLAAQASLAYATSGGLKLLHRDWWNGVGVLYVLASRSYGNTRLYAYFAERRTLATLAGMVVILGECALAAAPFAPPALCVALLCCGVLLHLGIARIHGLATFLWAFAASYPAVYFVSCWLYRGHR